MIKPSVTSWASEKCRSKYCRQNPMWLAFHPKAALWRPGQKPGQSRLGGEMILTIPTITYTAVNILRKMRGLTPV